MSRSLRNEASGPLAILLALALAAAGCAAGKTSALPSSTKGEAASETGDSGKPPRKAEMPKTVEISLRLSEGQAWKSRFVSTSEVVWTLKGADGKEQSRKRTVGLELVATQTVKSVSDGIARIEVDESAARILQEGQFRDVPFRRFDPPNPISFTVNVKTRELDFSAMEKAYMEWMGRVRQGPAGEILGKTFRLESYVAQLRELYGKPFTRLAGRRIAKGSSTEIARDVVLPFLGPGIALGATPVESSVWYEGMEVRKETGGHYLKAAGKYSGVRELSSEEFAGQLAEFDASAPAEFQSHAGIDGQFTSSVDVMAGREIFSTSQLRFSSSATFGGASVTQGINGKSMLEPAD